MVFAAIGSAIFGSTGSILAKRLLKTLEYHRYVAISFVIAFIAMLFFTPGFFVWPSTNLFTFGVLIIFAMNAALMNVFYLKGFTKEKLTESQSILLFAPLTTIILAAIFFPEERSILPFFLAIIALCAVLWSHCAHNHIRFHKGSKILFLAVLFMAIDSLLVKHLLTTFSPFTLYFLRMGIVAIILVSYYRPRFSGLIGEQLNITILTSIIPVIQYLLYYWSIASIGLVITSLIMSLQPMLTYFFAKFELKERATKKHVSATVVILICVLISQIV